MIKFLKKLFSFPDEIESNVEWTGPSVRVKDGLALLNSEEVKRDTEAARKLTKMREEDEK